VLSTEVRKYRVGVDLSRDYSVLRTWDSHFALGTPVLRTLLSPFYAGFSVFDRDTVPTKVGSSKATVGPKNSSARAAKRTPKGRQQNEVSAGKLLLCAYRLDCGGGKLRRFAVAAGQRQR